MRELIVIVRLDTITSDPDVAALDLVVLARAWTQQELRFSFSTDLSCSVAVLRRQAAKALRGIGAREPERLALISFGQHQG